MSEKERKRWRRFRNNWWLRLWLPVWVDRLLTLAAVGMAAWAVVAVSAKVDRQEASAAQQREGRAIAIRVLCGGEQGVIDGGRAALLGTLGGMPAPLDQRALRRRAARDYSIRVAAAIEREAGVHGLVDPHTGTLHCDVLVRSARAQP